MLLIPLLLFIFLAFDVFSKNENQIEDTSCLFSEHSHDGDKIEDYSTFCTIKKPWTHEHTALCVISTLYSVTAIALILVICCWCKRRCNEQRIGSHYYPVGNEDSVRPM